ncbi:MAG: class I SAM-dependent methyltransferase, partial [Candidatus Bipolaricaulia bacterium]
MNEGSQRENPYSPSYLGRTNSNKLYSFLRGKQPELVVETGVCNGLSTATILKAMHDNENGRLFSVDLPRTTEDQSRSAVIPAGESPGWAVPDSLKGRWEFREGDSIYRTPEILKKLHDQDRQIDLFLHDSEHSFEVMMIEFSLAW